MNNVEDRTLREQMNAKAKQSRHLTDEERIVLASELAKPEYAGLSIAEKLDRLNLVRTIPNPEPETRPRETIEALAVMNALKNKKLGDGRSAWRHLCDMADLSSDIWEAVDTIKNYSAAREVLSLANPAVAAFIPALVQLQLMDEDEVGALTSEPVPGRPETVEDIPLAVELLGPGAFVEASDLS